jgi:hypothetical protein
MESRNPHGDVWPGAFDLPPAVSEARVPDERTDRRAREDRVQPVELTAKKWKWLELSGCLLMALCSLGLLVFMPMAFAEGWIRFLGVVMAALLLLGVLTGLVRFVYARFGAWWYHG